MVIDSSDFMEYFLLAQMLGSSCDFCSVEIKLNTYKQNIADLQSPPHAHEGYVLRQKHIDRLSFLQDLPYLGSGVQDLSSKSFSLAFTNAKRQSLGLMPPELSSFNEPRNGSFCWDLEMRAAPLHIYFYLHSWIWKYLEQVSFIKRKYRQNGHKKLARGSQKCYRFLGWHILKGFQKSDNKGNNSTIHQTGPNAYSQKRSQGLVDRWRLICLIFSTFIIIHQIAMQSYGDIEECINEQIPLVVPPVVKQRRKRRKIVESPKSGSEESFQPDFNQYKKVGLPVDMKRVTTGSWGLEQNRIYLNFLENFKRDFENQVSRRKSTVFNRLSKALRKRTPDQCRSHHQKLQNRFQNNIEAIIEFVKSKIIKQISEGQDKGLKLQSTLKATATATYELEEDEGLEIDLGDLMIW